MKYVGYARTSKGGYILKFEKRVRTNTKWWQYLLQRPVYKTEIVKFIGDCTVWHTYPGFQRASTAMESRLAAAWTRIRHYENEDRKAGRYEAR